MTFPAIIALSGLDGTNGFRLDGSVAQDTSGYSISNAGDVNGDGFDDLIIGAPGVEPTPGSPPYGLGASYVVFGKASGFDATMNLSTLDGTNGFRLDGVAGNDLSGWSVSAAGDVNGDGFADVIIGAVGAGSFAGSSFVVFGEASGFAAAQNLSTLDGTNGFRLDGVAANDGSGVSVSGAGDVNGDGFNDLIVGANRAGSFNGSSYVVFGQASGFDATMNLSTLDGSNGFRLDGAGGERSGRSVSGAGDVNGDGFADLIIGGYAASHSAYASGSSYVVFGKASGFDATMNLSTLNGSNGFRLDGAAAYDSSGRPVSNAGDVNGDGFDDLIIGAQHASPNGGFSGSSYVVFGKALGFRARRNLSTLNGKTGFRLDGVAGNDQSGISVSAAGDVNGDGFADVIIGAYNADSKAGSSYVVFGKASGFDPTMNLSTLDGTNGFRLDGVTVNDRSGSQVSGAGDVNGDGFDDLMVGAYHAGPHGSISGSTYVVFGQAPTEAVTRRGTAANNDIHGGAFNDSLEGLGGDDTLTGLGGEDRLFGGEGADTMIGGTGNDIYMVDNVGDVVTEAAGEGTADRVRTTLLNYALGDNVERLAFTGSGNFSGTGNGLANILTGGAGNDILDGGGGKDKLTGGDGADLLSGGGGADTFVYSAPSQSTSTTHDTVTDFNAGEDRFDFDRTVSEVQNFGGTVNSGSFDFDLLPIMGDNIHSQSAVVVSVSGGDLAGHSLLVVAASSFYQAGSDYVVDITGFSGTLTAANFK